MGFGLDSLMALTMACPFDSHQKVWAKKMGFGLNSLAALKMADRSEMIAY
jgi:hypothetical protein